MQLLWIWTVSDHRLLTAQFGFDPAERKELRLNSTGLCRNSIEETVSAIDDKLC